MASKSCSKCRYYVPESSVIEEPYRDSEGRLVRPSAYRSEEQCMNNHAPRLRLRIECPYMEAKI